MGAVYKETYTKPLPAGAKIITRKGQRLVEYKDAKGKTRTVPYCDGSHQGSGITPLGFEIEAPATHAICNCGLSTNPPYCTGAHVTTRYACPLIVVESSRVDTS